jgi:L-lactate dehydrogenase complex protein LldE
VTCLVDLLYPEVGMATVAILERYGVTVDFPETQTCCGQPAFNSGFETEARVVGRGLLDAFDGTGPVIAPSGSCTAMVRTYFPRLFRGTMDEDRALNLASRTYELSEFLVDVLGIERADGRWPGRVTFHDSCHALRELGLSGQGRRLLGGLEGLELVEMDRPETCCGFGGTFSLRLPDLATAMADDKVAQAEDTGAEVLVAGDSGCLMHLAGRLSRRGSRVQPMHLASLLAKAQGLVGGVRGGSSPGASGHGDTRASEPPGTGRP